MKKKYNIALIGCGAMGEAHLDDIYCREDIILKYVCDLDINRAENFKRRYSAAIAVKDYEIIMNDNEVDIVIAAVYPSMHLEILKKCISHKKHLICEKPIADNLHDGEEMIRMIRNNSDVKVLIGYILRHNESYKKIASMIHEDAIGHPIIMRMTQNHHTMDWQKYLKLINETSPIVDCGVHYVDVMRWFTGAEPVEVSAIGQRTEADVISGSYNYGLMTVKMSDGSVAYYEAGWGNTISAENIKEFIGPKGRIRLTYQMFRSHNQEEGDLIEYYRYPGKTYESINVLCNRKPTGAQLSCLIDMIENDSQPIPSYDDVLKSFKTVLRADKIIKNNL